MAKLSNKKIFYVYALLDPRKPGPFYIGKGKGERVFSHLGNDDRSTNNHKKNKIAKIRLSNKEPIAQIKKTKLTEKQALDIEVKLILKVGRSKLNTGPLTNLTNGGEGSSGAIVSNKTRRKLSTSLLSSSKTWWTSTKARNNKIEATKETIKNRTVRVQKEISKKISIGVSNYYRSPSNSAKVLAHGKAISLGHKSREDKEKAKTSRAMSASANEKYKNMSKVEKESLAKRNSVAGKVRNSLANKIKFARNHGVVVVYKGKRVTLVELVHKFGKQDFYRKISRRISLGWSLKDALNI